MVVWQYEIDMPPDGQIGGVGASFKVTQNALWEQVALVYLKDNSGHQTNVVDIGAHGASDSASIASHVNPFTLLVNMEFKPTGASQWSASALNLLASGDTDQGTFSPDNPMYRSKWIVIGAEDDPHNKSEGNYVYGNCRLYILYDGPSYADVRNSNIAEPPPR